MRVYGLVFFAGAILGCGTSDPDAGDSGTGDDAGNHVCDPVNLLKGRTSSLIWGNAGEVTDFFLNILYPSEGAANLKLYRDAGISFLPTGRGQ